MNPEGDWKMRFSIDSGTSVHIGGNPIYIGRPFPIQEILEPVFLLPKAFKML